MREYQVVYNNEYIDLVCGYNKEDALRRNPKYNSPEYSLVGGWYID